jgi:hypothetical protein
MVPVAMALLLAGCLAPASVPDPGAPETPPTPREWPALAEDLVRPGTGLDSFRPALGPAGQADTPYAGCTVNFVFTSPINDTLYLGTAAHCVEGNAPPYVFHFTDRPGTATLAYSSWETLRARGVGSDREASPLRENDFALLAVDPAHRDRVHPAVLHLGGPTGLAAEGAIGRGDALLTYGRSYVRADAEPLRARGGCATYVDPWVIRGAFPGTVGPGDSGSPLLLQGGEAAAVMVRIGGPTEGDGPAVGNGMAINLRKALDYMAHATGMVVDLATWPLLEPPGVAPPSCVEEEAAAPRPATSFLT